MPKYAVCNRSSYKDYPWAIHKAGCPDVERNEKRGNGAHVDIEEHPTAQGAIDLILDAETRGMGYDESYVRVFPCVKEVA